MEIFQKGLVHGFGKKNRACFWGKLGEKTSFIDILNKLECFVDQKNGVLEKSKRSCEIMQRG